MQTYTPAHTHATLQGLHTCELVAELVICDALQLVGRGEFGSVSVAYPLYLSLHSTSLI